MTFLLALKNTRLYFLKRLPLALFLAATLGLLFLGNTVFSGTDEGLSRAFRTSLSADLSVSAASEDPFTLFGSELPLLGEFFKMPLILDYDRVLSRVQGALPTAHLEPVVVGAAKISLGGFSSPAPLFAVNLRSYLAFFPSLKVVLGAPPPPGQPGIFLNQHMYDKASAVLGRRPALGETLLLASAQDNSFALREAPLYGVFDYPVYDPILENVALVDAGTGRALAGYFVTQAEPTTTQAPVTVQSVDDLFAGAQDTQAPTTGGLNLETVTKDLAEHSQAPVEDPKTWNFLLISTPNPVKAAAILEEALKAASSPLQVRDWRDTAGGNAKIVWFIQLLFNLGLVFVSLIAGLIVMNSMSLAVAERSQEIGTLRSLGASRAFVGKLISYETVILVAGAGILGVAAGVFVILGLHLRGGVSVSNPFLATLLGTNRYSPSLSWVLVAEHFALSFALGLVATILPVKRALQVSPRQAMARE